MTLEAAARTLEHFKQGALTARLSHLETAFEGVDRKTAQSLCTAESLDERLLQAALSLKRVAGQINVVIHAVGILVALPRILEPRERVEYLSLGAGNTGREFDLVTDRRVAEFKFIRWRGGAEAIRQNALFKDFFGLAEAQAGKQRFLYLLGLTHPLNFLNGQRALASVMSRNSKLATRFRGLYGDRFAVVSEYYHHRKRAVQLVDLLALVPALSALPDEGLAV